MVRTALAGSRRRASSACTLHRCNFVADDRY